MSQDRIIRVVATDEGDGMVRATSPDLPQLNVLGYGRDRLDEDVAKVLSAYFDASGTPAEVAAEPAGAGEQVMTFRATPLPRA